MSAITYSCSRQFHIATSLDIAVKAFQASSSIVDASLFAINGVAATYCCNNPHTISFSNRILSLPTYFTQKLIKNTGIDCFYLRLLSPAAGMTILSLAGRLTYDLMPYPALKGLVYGIHTYAMGILANNSKYNQSLSSLRQIVYPYTLFLASTQKNSGNGDVFTHVNSEYLSSAMLVIASFALSFFGFHVITANVLAHALAATVKYVSYQTLSHFAEKEAPARR